MSKSSFSRRKFLSTSLLTTAGLGALPHLSFGASAAISPVRDSSKVRLGFIGLGRQAVGLLGNFMKNPNVEVTAAADVYEIKLERFKLRTGKLYEARGQKSDEIQLYADYKELLKSDKVDAVVISSPDHWHALMAIDACRAGKDIYLEKPLTFTVKEGQELVKAVRANGIVLGVGNMQRGGANFQHAVRMVQKGYLGKISTVYANVGANPFPKQIDYETQPIPAGLDWKAWNGPIPTVPFFSDLNPPISLNPEVNEKAWGAWRWYKKTGGGLMTDWGAHMFDIAQWGIGMDRNGPIEVIVDKGNEPMKFRYANGIEMIVSAFDGSTKQGVKFIGEKGWITVGRGDYNTSVKEAEMKFTQEQLGFSAYHVDFIDSVLMRKDPITPVEVGHSTCTVCTIGNIAHELGHSLKWDPIAQVFIGDEEANSYLHYNY